MHGRDDSGSCGGGGGGRGSGRNGCSKIPCQVYGKTGHNALRCYKCFDANYHGEEKVANAASTGYNVDTKWYTDTSATNHITFKLDRLMMHEKFGGSDQVHTASGPGMPISHIS
jgi:hypothetical protein